MAVGRHHHILNARCVGLDVCNQLAVLRAQLPADSIRDHDGGGTGLDDLLDNLAHKVRVGSAGVFCGELDIIAAECSQVGHSINGPLDHLQKDRAGAQQRQ